MSESGQKAEFTGQRGGVTRYVEDLDWLYNDALGHLGLKAICYEELAQTSAPAVIVDTWHLHERIHKSGWAVRKVRRLEGILGTMLLEDAQDLALQYKVRPLPAFFQSNFGRVAGLVERVTREGEDPAYWVSKASDHKKQIKKINARAEKLSDRIHEEFRKAKLTYGRNWADKCANG